MNKRALLTTVVVLFIVSLISVSLWMFGGINLNAVSTPGSPGGNTAYAAEKAIIGEASARGIVASPQFKQSMGGVFPFSCDIGTGGNNDKYEIDTGKVLEHLLPLLSLAGASEDEGCYEIDIDITIRATVYVMNPSSLILVVRPEGEIIVRYYVVDSQGNCTVRTITITLPPGETEMAFKINNDFSMGDPTPLPGGKPICTFRIPSINIEEKIGELNKETCPLCNRAQELEGGPR